MHKKDFQAWHKRKAQIEASTTPPPFFYEREVWWVFLGHNIGFEEDGKGHGFARPVLILRKFSPKLFWAVPLSTTPKQGRYYYSLTYQSGQRSSTALLSQLRALDSSRLTDKIGKTTEEDFRALQERITALLKN